MFEAWALRSRLPGRQAPGNGDAGVQARIRALWRSVHPVPVLIILSLGVAEEWRWEEGRVAMVETGRRPLWTANRWDPTPSSHINARDTSACSHDRLLNRCLLQWRESLGAKEIIESRGQKNSQSGRRPRRIN